jgi:putative transposase
MSASDRRAKLERAHPDLSIRRQCAMLGVARSGVYRKPRPVNDNDLEAMRRIDALFTAHPFYGARRIARTLSKDGFPIDRKRARRLMRQMGIEALGPKPRTSKPAPGHKIYSAHAEMRKLAGWIMRKLSVIESANSPHLRGTSARRKWSIASANSR